MNAEFGGKYHGGNVILSGTHTHSGPSGFLSYALYNIPNRGFVQETFDAIVEGILDVSLIYEIVVFRETFGETFALSF